MKLILLLFAIAFMVFHVQANPVIEVFKDVIEPKLVDEEGTTLATYTCNNKKGICQRRDWACPSGYIFVESLNDCPNKKMNKCCTCS